ncbi:hypothetical protein GQ53DRAFT_718607 [Thozetella sp. PMI_491]|nr:hypothetical protein GQ53DRAFT_718607 [Thozetella sp. PMI_491]
MSNLRKRRPYRKSRFGCRNCKLRRVKVNLQCDEAKPRCQRCRDYGVLCNFVMGVSAFQTSSTQLPWTRVGDADPAAGFDIGHPRSLNLPATCSDGTVSFVMDAECMSRLERFRTCTLHPFSPEMRKIWKDQVPHVAFRSPYLMHTMLAVAVAHERYTDGLPHTHRTRAEARHSLQCVALFNQKLSRPIDLPDRDTLWATAALLGLMATASFEAITPEEAWPLRPSYPWDLEWFRLNNAKKAIWDLTDPLRPGGLFRPMSHEYGQFHFQLPPNGPEGLPRCLADVCGISSSSSEDNNPYYVSAHVLARLNMPTENGQSPGIRMVTFMSQSHPSFRTLLLQKDPVALLMLALWYAQAGGMLWWLEQRARVEGHAIRIYLERFHGNDEKVQRLLPSLSVGVTRLGI